MKNFRLFIIIVILFLLPAVSWYYLTIGRDWRRETLDELGKYGEIADFSFQTDQGHEIALEDISGKNILLNIIEDQVALENVRRVYDQFDGRKEFLFISLNKKSIDHIAVKANPERWVFTDCSTGLCDDFISKSFKHESQSAALIDKNGNIRHFYDLAEEDDLKSLVKHMAIMVPPKKREKLELKRKPGI